jgi:hypothetical protein
MRINTLAGRTYNDLNQYPGMPGHGASGMAGTRRLSCLVFVVDQRVIRRCVAVQCSRGC